jgi:fused signal recognition particle receptor
MFAYTQLSLETLFLVGQSDQPPANPVVEYTMFAVIGLVVLALIIKGLKSKPDFEASARRPKPDQESGGRTASDIETEARRVFEIPHVAVDEENATSQPQVRIMRTEQEKTPSTRDASLDDREKRGQPVEVTPDPEEDSTLDPEEDSTTERAGKTLSQGLARTKAGFVARLGQLFRQSQTIDENVIGDLEETLFTADIGVRTSQRLVDMVQANLASGQLKDSGQVWGQLKTEIRQILSVETRPFDLDSHRPHVIMVVGVNGAGKTTSIGKLASLYAKAGKKVMLAAGDTFRAAAVEQLEVWGDRAGVPVVRGRDQQDPSSVIFDACRKAVDENYDVLIADTAGRLQAKKELMDELGKIHRVIGKAIPGAPHSVWLVLDATVGQNAISQAKEFSDTVALTGLVLTKLDGTAKGGVVIGICDEMKLPVRYIGIGEQVEDLRAFDPDAFADALLDE